MNDTFIVTTYVVIDTVLKAYGLEDDCRATCTAANILTVGVIAAKYFQNHHERALSVMTRLGYVHGLSVSRFNRRLHALRDWLYGTSAWWPKYTGTGRCSSSIVCRCQSANGRAPRVARKYVGKRSVAIAPPKRRNLRLAFASDLYA
jgi:hypothetical protein